MSKCKHENTIIWEPHLAVARKCTDCKMVYNPNMGGWHTEGPSDKQRIQELERQNSEYRSEQGIEWANNEINAMSERIQKLEACCRDLVSGLEIISVLDEDILNENKPDYLVAKETLHKHKELIASIRKSDEQRI